MINKSMKYNTTDSFFDDINFVSILDNIKGIMTSDGTISMLLDFERCLDEADLYAFENWELGELVQGPNIKRYSVSCIFMWPYKLMPDPNGAKRLAQVGCNVSFKKSKIKIPIAVNNEDDFIPGTRYPKSVEKKVWLVLVEVPKELMNDIKEGSIDLANQTIDLDDIEKSYEEDLDKENNAEDTPPDANNEMGGTPPQLGPGFMPTM